MFHVLHIVNWCTMYRDDRLLEKILALKAEMNRYQGQDEEIEAETEDTEESPE